MNINNKDIFLLFISTVIAVLISFFFYAITYKCIASYYDAKNESFIFEYKNKFGIKKYSLRKVQEAYEKKLNRKKFNEIKETLVRRIIP